MAIAEPERPRIAGMRQFAFAQIGSRLSSEPDLVAAYWRELGAAANPAHPDITVLYYSLEWMGQRFALLEFVAGETLEELVKRTDPASCEREIPMFCRLLDAFEGVVRNGHAVAQPDIELIDFGVARARTSTTTKLHGAILIRPDGTWSETIFGDFGASHSQVCALLMEVCSRLPGSLPRSGVYGPVSLGECAVSSLASILPPIQVIPPAAVPAIKATLLAKTVASPYVIAVATAALILCTLHGVAHFLAKSSSTASADQQLLPPPPALVLEVPVEISPEVEPPPADPISVRPAPQRWSAGQPISSIVLTRGATPIRQTSLEYPAEAKKENVSGMVEMQLTIAEDGSVQSPRVLSGDPLLQAGLAEEISKWVYQPMRVNGTPVPMTTELAIKFNLSQ